VKTTVGIWSFYEPDPRGAARLGEAGVRFDGAGLPPD